MKLRTDIFMQIGHLEGAAGLAGVIKCILMLEKGTILPNIHFEKPNRRIPFKDWKIRVPTTLLPWPSNCLRRASVNSFGYGGTNAHAILDDAGEFLSARGLQCNPVLEPLVVSGGKVCRSQRLFVFSARDDAALDRMRIQYDEHLERLMSTSELQNETAESAFLDELSFTLSSRRSRFDWKAHVSASSIGGLRDVLTRSKFSPVRSTTEPRVGFIFTGQGAQWARMGIELLQYPIFKASVHDADTYLKQILGSEWSVIEELHKDHKTSSIQRAKISQPVCTVLQVALVDLLRSWKVRPSAVVGHSSGEIGAAYCYGAITREDAWKISYWRGKICSELHDEVPELKGSMMAAGLSPNAAQKYIAELTQGQVVVACVNSPSSVTISGDEVGIDELSELLKANSVFCRKLKVENAYHSHHMQLIKNKYLESIAGFSPKIPASSLNNMKMASSVTGDLVTHSDLGPEYWIRNLVSPVLFSNAVQALSKSTGQRRRRAKVGESALDFLLEVGPHAALKGPLRQILQDQAITNFTYRSMILRGEDAVKTATETAGILHCHGVRVSVSEVSNFQHAPKPLTNLPSYPWNHALKYWSESRLSQNYRSREHGRHDLLGSVAIGSDELEPKWRHFLRISENPWIQDHVVQSSILYPGAGIIAMPIEGAKQLADKDTEIDGILLRDVQISKAIVINDAQEGVETFLHMRRQNLGPNRSWTGWWEFTVTTRIEDQDPQENGSGLVKVKYKLDAGEHWTTERNLEFESLQRELSHAKEICCHRIEPKDFYETTAIVGLQYGPSFQGLTEIYSGNSYCHCVISIPDTKLKMPAQVESSHLIHPTTLDVIFHSLFAALGEDGLEFKNAAVPIAFESLFISADLPSGAGSQFSGFCHATRSGSREVIADIYMSDMKWDVPKVEVKGIRCRELPRTEATNSTAIKAPCGTLVWKADIDFLDAGVLPGYLAAEHHPGNKKTFQFSDVTNTSRKGILKVRCISKDICPSPTYIQQMVELAAHKNPDLSLLQVGGVASEFPASILSTIMGDSGSTPLFSKYILADIDHKAIESSKELLQDWNSRVAFTVLDESLDLTTQNFTKSSIDMIIIFTDVNNVTQREQLIYSIREVLKPGGYVLAFTNQVDGKLAEDLNHWKKTTFDGEPLSLLLWNSTKESSEKSGANTESLIIARKKTPQEADKLPETVFVLTPQVQSKEITSIANEIMKMASQEGMQARMIAWPPQLSEIKSHSVVSLLELETSFLADISYDDFNTLKSLLLETRSIV
jgi:acyl transferase domain-containing protein